MFWDTCKATCWTKTNNFMDEHFLLKLCFDNMHYKDDSWETTDEKHALAGFEP